MEKEFIFEPEEKEQKHGTINDITATGRLEFLKNIDFPTFALVAGEIILLAYGLLILLRQVQLF